MQKLKEILIRWGPPIVIMLAIAAFSSTPGGKLPNFGSWDAWVKKAGHVIGYALLAVSFWRAIDYSRNRIWIAWMLSVLYGLTDEFHQSFVPGRHPSLIDAFLFDGGGAVLGLLIIRLIRMSRKMEQA